VPWKRLLKSLQAAERHSDKVRGMTFTDPAATTVTLVRDYLRVARYGTVDDIAQAIGRCADGQRGVRGVCETLVGAGELDVTESLTRGPLATKRRTYRTREGAVWTNTLPE